MFLLRRNHSTCLGYLIMLGMCILYQNIPMVQSHGRMEEPAARNAAWRHGFKVPANYNDLELNCGGVGQQHGRFGGKCGVCGDSLGAAVREHEVGGKYATGTIVRSYVSGQWIDINIVLSANHLGFMQFKLCAVNSAYIDATQECLDQTVLEVNGYGPKYPVRAEERNIQLKAKLPDGFACSHCILQWKYKAGNNWGTENGQSGLGVGPQEEFYNCADIQIKSNGAPWTQPPVVSTTPSVQTSQIIIQTSTLPVQTPTPYVTTTPAVQPQTSTPVPISTTPGRLSSSTPAIASSTVGLSTPVVPTTSAQVIYSGKVECKPRFTSLIQLCYDTCSSPEKKCYFKELCNCNWSK